MFQIRPETPADGATVESLADLGFGPDRRNRTVYRLRVGPPTAGLAFVAADPTSDAPLATLRFWCVSIGGALTSLLLGPLAVCPDRRGQGLGRALISNGLALARDQGWPLCLVSGEPDYYRPFGFEPAAPLGLVMPGPIAAGALQVKALQSDGLDGLAAIGDRTLRAHPGAEAPRPPLLGDARAFGGG